MKDQNSASFILTGFNHDLGFRVFEFDYREKGRTVTQHTVRADLLLVRKHGIHIQDLPLLCRKVLDDCEDQDRTGSMTLSEAAMVACAEQAAARHQAGKRRKPPQPGNGNTAPELDPAGSH
ncbi:MAG: hypothetical protein LAO79_28095 [Acidobacteriia bacterium]|nr:hypothetical protein [Terriglobia bacterium]